MERSCGLGPAGGVSHGCSAVIAPEAKMDKFFIMSAAVIAGIGALSDARTRRIPNWLTYTGVGVALSTKCMLSGWSGLESSCAAIVVAGGLFCILFLLGGMGGGDVKLMITVGAWAGVSHIISILLFTAVSGGFLAFACIVANWKLEDKSAIRAPYGVAIAMGTVCCAGSAYLWR